MEKIKPERVFTYRVTHPQHDDQLVALVNPPANDIFALATHEASRRWGVPWGKVVGLCRSEPISEAWRRVCVKCKKPFLTEALAEKCPGCILLAKKEMAHFMRRHPVDKRINAGK